MALQITHKDNTGTTHDKCYCKIKNITISDKKAQIEPSSDAMLVAITIVEFYHDKKSRDEGLNPVETRNFVKKSFDENSLGNGSLRELFYSYLKTLDTYSVSTDV